MMVTALIMVVMMRMMTITVVLVNDSKEEQTGC